jgi:hypothetical protein
MTRPLYRFRAGLTGAGHARTPRRTEIQDRRDAPDRPVSFGDLLIELELSKRGGLVIGLRAPSGKEVINPPKNYVVEPGTLLI